METFLLRSTVRYRFFLHHPMETSSKMLYQKRERPWGRREWQQWFKELGGDVHWSTGGPLCVPALWRQLRGVSSQGDGQGPFRPPGFQGRRLSGKEHETIKRDRNSWCWRHGASQRRKEEGREKLLPWGWDGQFGRSGGKLKTQSKMNTK